jgi:hypothetical protein
VPSQGLVLAEVAVDHQENEIVAAPQILKQVNLSGVLVIGDAMQTQRRFQSKSSLPMGITCGWSKTTNRVRVGRLKSCQARHRFNAKPDEALNAILGVNALSC